jgi:hypothetical protein
MITGVLVFSYLMSLINLAIVFSICLTLLGMALLMAILVSLVPSTPTINNKSDATDQNSYPNPNNKLGDNVFRRWSRELMGKCPSLPFVHRAKHIINIENQGNYTDDKSLHADDSSTGEKDESTKNEPNR